MCPFLEPVHEVLEKKSLLVQFVHNTLLSLANSSLNLSLLLKGTCRRRWSHDALLGAPTVLLQGFWLYLALSKLGNTWSVLAALHVFIGLFIDRSTFVRTWNSHPQIKLPNTWLLLGYQLGNHWYVRSPEDGRCAKTVHRRNGRLVFRLRIVVAGVRAVLCVWIVSGFGLQKRERRREVLTNGARKNRCSTWFGWCSGASLHNHPTL